MKILVVTPGFCPTTKQQGGAIEKLVDNYLNYNEEKKDEIVVYSPKISSEKYDRDIYKSTKFRIIDKTRLGFNVVKVIRKIFNKLFKRENANAYIYFVVKDILRKKEQNKYDMIIFENGIDYINYFCKKVKTNSKVVIHLHNDYLNIDTPHGKKILNNCYQVWAVSEYIKSRVEEIENNTNKVKVLSNALEENVFNKPFDVNEQKQLRKSLNINDEFVFIYTGRLIPAKGVKELILAFNNLSLKRNDIKLLIVGGNTSYKNSGSYFNELQHMANDNVCFTGYIPVSELYKYYSIADGQVVPTLCNEAFGLILLEGMYFKLPIIASNSGAMPEICGDSAIYVDKSNIVSELEEKMLYVVENKKKLQKNIDNYDNILANYTMKNYCETFYNLLHK